MARLTAFSWGYYGWGNHTKKLLQTVDSIEKRRGYDPPIFIDVRLRREVRANGFRDDAFEEMASEKRYRWIPKLGNRNIVGNKDGVRIDDPNAVLELLSLIATAQKDRRRVIFFCACQDPHGCHRHNVGSLLLKVAKSNGFDLTVVEWPGGEPGRKPIKVAVEDPASWRKVLAGSESIPLPRRYPQKGTVV